MKKNTASPASEPLDIQPTARPVVRALNDIGDGAFLVESSSKLMEVVAAVHENGGKGEITIKLKISKSGNSMVKIDSDVSSKKPKPAKLPTVLYSSEDGQLLQYDPRQGQLDLEDADEPANQKAA